MDEKIYDMVWTDNLPKGSRSKYLKYVKVAREC
jgi:hypothetical protein